MMIMIVSQTKFHCSFTVSVINLSCSLVFFVKITEPMNAENLILLVEKRFNDKSTDAACFTLFLVAVWHSW